MILGLTYQQKKSSSSKIIPVQKTGLVMVFLFVISISCIGQNRSDIKNGVVIYDSAHCMNGITCNTGYQFIDMHGNLIKTRKAELSVTIDAHRYAGISSHEKFSLFNDDTIVWSFDGAPHHVAFLDEDTNIVALGYELRSNKKGIQLYYEVLGTLNLKGEVVKIQSLFPLADEIPKFLPENRDSILKRNKEFVTKYIPNRLVYFDSFFFHINSVQIIPANASEKKDSAFKQENLLISDFLNNFIAIVDRNDFHILWFYFQPESLLGQHGAQMLPDGRIIYLVNNIKDKNTNSYFSAVRILNPVTRKIEWEYTGSPAHSLHSFTQGWCQYLKNGNVLITINNVAGRGEGYVIEVTPSKDVVWKWIPPDYKELIEKEEGFTKVLRLD